MYESKSLVALVKAYGRHQYTLGQLSMINAPTGEASSNPFREIAIKERQLSKDILNDIFHEDRVFVKGLLPDEFTG